MGVPFLYHHSDQPSGGQSNKTRQNPSTIATTKNGFLCKVCWFFSIFLVYVILAKHIDVCNIRQNCFGNHASFTLLKT